MEWPIISISFLQDTPNTPKDWAETFLSQTILFTFFIGVGNFDFESFPHQMNSVFLWDLPFLPNKFVHPASVLPPPRLKVKESSRVRVVWLELQKHSLSFNREVCETYCSQCRNIPRSFYICSVAPYWQKAKARRAACFCAVLEKQFGVHEQLRKDISLTVK